MISIACFLAALLAVQGATPAAHAPRKCEPADNRCKAELFVQRATAAASPKDRALHLHAAHRSYLALFDETGDTRHLCAARRTFEQSVAVEGQPEKQRASFTALLVDLTSREQKKLVRCEGAAKRSARRESARIAATTTQPASPSAGTSIPRSPKAGLPNAMAGVDLLLEPGVSTHEPPAPALLPVRARPMPPHTSPRSQPMPISGTVDIPPGRPLLLAGGVTLGVGLGLTAAAGFLGGRLAHTRRAAESLLDEVDGYATDSQLAMNDALVRDYRRLGPPTLTLAIAGGTSIIVAAVLLGVGSRRAARAASRTAVLPVPGGLAFHARF